MNVIVMRCAVALSLLASTASAASAEPPVASPATSTTRYVHTPDLAKTITPYLSPQGFMDPEFSASLGTPSAYLGDFFGSQAIADVSADEILRDVVPRLATLISRDAHSITVRFAKGYTATFYPRSSIDVKGAVAEVSHVTVTGDGWRGIRANVADLVATIERAGLQKRYLLPNPFYREELQVAAQLRNGPVAKVTVDPDLAAFDRSANALLLMPEGVHGISTDADRLMGLLGKHKIGWLAIEMAQHENQRDFDAFNNAKAGTAAYAAARAKMVAYFAQAWNGRHGPRTTGEENYYFKLLEAAHAAGTKVYAVEAGTLPFLLFRYGETNFGSAVRSLLWVRNMPAIGRGAIFGGSAHFKTPLRGRVQDLIARFRPGTRIFSLTDLNAPTR